MQYIITYNNQNLTSCILYIKISLSSIKMEAVAIVAIIFCLLVIGLIVYGIVDSSKSDDSGGGSGHHKIGPGGTQHLLGKRY